MAYNLRKGPQRNLGQPCFLVYPSVDLTNVTGDGTQYGIVFDTAKFNQNSNFSLGGSAFTAAVTGRYLLVTTISMSGLTSSHLGTILRFQGSAIYRGWAFNPYAVSVSGACTMNFSQVVKMNRNDTISSQIIISGGTKVVNVVGGSVNTFFAGYLLS